MTPRERWIFIAISLGLVCGYTVAVYSMGQATCAGLSFGFY